MATIEERIKSSKQKLGEKIPCSIEILTPVHIGSGVKLAEGIDFIKTENSVHIVSQAELMKHLEDNPDEMKRFCQGNYKLSALNRIPDGKRYYISIGRTSEINEFEKNGNGKPYIPGSSIKGAIRTILLEKRFSELLPEEKNLLLNKVTNNKKEWASSPILENLFGPNSNENLMRILEVFDAEFSELELAKILILSLINSKGTTYGWKQLWKKQNTPDPNQASQIIAETLPIGAKGYFSISLNNFLYNDATAQFNLHFNENALRDIRDLKTIINNYSKQKLTQERHFFENLGSPRRLDLVIEEIDNLLSKINNISEDELIMRISWGSGWKWMTGDFIDDLIKDDNPNEKWIDFFRSKYNKPKNSFGKDGFPIFPKTRKIIFDVDIPRYLTGWIKIKLFDKAPDIKSQSNTIEIKKDQELDSIEKLASKFKVKVEKKI